MRLDDRYTDFQFWENDTLEKIGYDAFGLLKFWHPFDIDMIMTSFDGVEETLYMHVNFKWMFRSIPDGIPLQPVGWML
jgi:hypothetical protein